MDKSHDKFKLKLESLRSLYGTNVCCVCQEESSGAHTCCICGQIIHAICADNTLETEEGFGSKVTCPRCAQKECMSANKEKAIDGLQAQADTMKKLSNQKFPAVEVGNTVTVPIPSVDRAKGDARNLLCVVTEKTEDGFYKVFRMDFDSKAGPSKIVRYGDSDYEETLLKWAAEVDEENENGSGIDSDAELIYSDNESVRNKNG
ncbi:unnamed protein product [Acanthoscelides obtectus]|uniref:SCAN domain-containing protein n=1 Tax=Acanthoscelides obtectus TaxID=200917 RepID=A0A9P0KKU1_ACAOB|nr:unnamed protein product [Acanthoscelides obtectus]CAK1654731.1 hypothetical protein AOBTE_LOCUS18799 [Acanthoscelides obtectus]